jgi:hypothetical protein
MNNDGFISSISMDGEEWRNVVGFEGKYMVSSYGRVASLSFPIIAGALHYCRKPHLLNATNDINGYLSVGLTVSKNKTKRIKVHRLVASAFIPNPENYNIINHKDEDKRNNRADNLEWCTCGYNIRYGSGLSRRTHSFLSHYSNCKKVAQLDNLGNIIKIYPGLIHAAEAVNRDYSAITCAINRNGKCAGYRWAFVE